jgi:hypothetical protein
MALSRLSNFLRSSRGKILHVNPENLDASDSIINSGDTPFTPFKTLNRALIEASRYSYQVGLNNDRFNFCTILLYSGTHYVDNRPGLVIEDDGTSYVRNGAQTSLTQFDLTTVMDLSDPENKLYLLNSVYGGLIVPRGTSIIANDLRKTEVIPLYVPDSRNANIERSAIFRTTGASFFYGFTVTDADPTGFCYKNYNKQKFVPNFSHHKLTAFEYVDGVNPVKINDTFLDVNTTRTDLQQYYEKISIVYGASSGKEIDSVSYIGGVSVDIQPVIDEYRIVGPRGEQVGISSIRSGNGVTPTEVITVTLDSPVKGISVDTAIQVSGVFEGFDGQFVVSAIPSENQIQYKTSEVPVVALPSVFGATLNIISDTTASSSPYVNKVSLKSSLGLCGLHADGSKVEGFKSFVVAEFTAISLQKDNDAFVIYDETSGTYVDSNVVPDLYKNTRARYKPDFENYHVKLSNDAFAQLVSVFSIGYAAQIIAESGGDYSITNSNSNFGAKSFIASGFKSDAFDQDDHGFIVGIVPPENILNSTINVEFPQIDVGVTTTAAAGAATTTRLYLYNEKSLENPPKHFINGYKIGAKIDEKLFINYPSNVSSNVVIPGTTSSYEKTSTVQRQNNNTQNAITNGVISLTSAHAFSAGEKVRVFSDNAHLPDGIGPNIVYYVIDSTIDNTLTSSQIKLAATFNNFLNNVAVLPNRKGGILEISSKVYDKIPNEPGHPIQWDSNLNNWYVTVNSVDNGIYSTIRNTNRIVTGKTYITRTPDNRTEDDKIYKLVYCIPRNTTTAARPPVDGFVIQESGDSSLSGSEFSRYFGGVDLDSDTELRNPKFISNAAWASNEVTFTTELDHKLKVNDQVEINNILPVAYNGSYTVTRIPSSRSFVVTLTSDPGTFANNTTVRNSSLPFVKRKNTNNIFKIYKSKELKKFIRNKQDGLYELYVLHSSVKPTIAPFTGYSFSQPVKNLYPRLERDNFNSDPQPSQCFADHNLIGNVFVDDNKNSITRESFNKLSSDFAPGIGITAIVSNQAGTAHTLYTTTDHGLSAITSVSVVGAGVSYITGTYYGVGVTTTSGGNAASFKVVVDVNGEISSADIMSGGSNYKVNDVLIVSSGIATTTGFSAATLSVTGITTDTKKSISLYGSDNYSDTFTIQSIPSSNRINVTSEAAVSGASTIIVSGDYFATINGRVLDISSLTYNNVTGISTVTTTGSHGLNANTKVRIAGFTSSFYNKDVVVTSVNSLNQIEVYSGISTTSLSTAGSGKIIPLGVQSIIGNSRASYYYSGITTTTGTILNQGDPDSTLFDITNAATTGLVQGDYIEVNGEVLRIKSPITTDLVGVYRAQFGTDRKTHPVNSVVKKIEVIPVELRRTSIIRSSGGTFEYVGFGAGNYSTSLPENQDRNIEDVEKLLSQATKSSGGVINYSGMDENGDFYSGNKKLVSSTGIQKIYDLPAPSVAGESESEELINLIEAEQLLVSESLRVDGGENNENISVFNSPVVLNNKLISYSDEGLEAISVSLKGDSGLSRKYTVSDVIPTISGNYGDVIFRATPSDGQNIGWVYTTNDTWRTWGYVGDLGTQVALYSGTETGPNTLEGIVDKIKFVGDPDGFGIDVDIDVDAISGFATVILRNPLDSINFGTSLGRNTPTFGSRSVGSRNVYYETLNSTNVDYAVGVSTNTLWHSVPQNTNAFSFKWFGGETEIMSLTGDGQLSIAGGIIATINGDVEGNATTATTATDLSRSVIAGAGLTGGGQLNNNRTINVVGAANGGIQVNEDSIQVDSTVVRTTGNQTISGSKTFSNPIIGNLTGTATTATTATNLSRTLTAGNGLTGGGQLNADRTINVGVTTNGGIQVNEDSIQVDSTVVRTTGNQTIGGVKTYTNENTFSSNVNLEGTNKLGEGNYVANNNSNNIIFNTTRFISREGNIVLNNSQILNRSWLFGINSSGNLEFSNNPTGSEPENWTRRVTFASNGDLVVPGVFNNTGSGSNVVVNANGVLQRQSSSIKYKEDVEDADVNISKNTVYNTRPVKYKSKKKENDLDWSYWGFIAEEVAEIDPRLVIWKTTETIKDEETGEYIQQDLETAEPESIDYARYVVHLVNVIKDHKCEIDELKERIIKLENKNN